MLDLSHLPKPQNGTIDYFPGFSPGDGEEWEVWNKPKNCMFIRITCISGGSGGASGFPSATTNSRGGGGGGGGAGFLSYVTYPANFLPDRLYISAGLGGKGGASSTTISNPGSEGAFSYVTIAPLKGAISSTQYIYLICASGKSIGGRAATASSGGSVASSGQLYTLGGANLGYYGHFFSTVSVSPGAGGGAAAGGTGSSGSYSGTPGFLCSGGGGGGGGAGFAGGGVITPASQTSVLNLFRSPPGGVGGTADSPIGGNGSNGINLFQPLMSCGGTGGGSSFDGVAKGGDGGDGGLGSGGGGGGAGGTDGGGKGGDGGPGLVIIHTW